MATTSTLAMAWEMYYNLVLASSSDRSKLSESGRWRNHIVPFFGNGLLLDKITNQDILLLRTYLVKKKLSPQTIAHCLSLLRRVMHRALQWNLFDGRLPVFDMPKFDNKRVRFLTRQEANKLLFELSMRSKLWHDISLFALHTGLRANEIFSLRIGHYDMNNSSICVFDTKVDNRIVPLNSKSEKILQEYSSGNGYLFTDCGEQIKHVNRIFTDAVKACQLNQNIKDRRQKVVFHTLRHTFASWLVQAGTPLMVVSQLLGHKSLQMTQRYAHLAPTQGASAVKMLEDDRDDIT